MPEKYSYHIQEKSLTQGVLTKFIWNPVVARIPTRWTPNSITVFGALFVLVSIVFVMLGLQGQRWGFSVAGLCIFIYMTCDNIDGPHARRTGQSSRLGEFLDHWLDAIDSVVMNICIMFMLGFSGWFLVISMVLVVFSFFATIWEHCHTGVFHSGRLGTNEALIIIIILYISMTFLFGHPFATYEAYAKLNLASGILYLTSIGCFLTLLGILWRVRNHFIDFFPIVIIISAMILWFYHGILTDTQTAICILLANLFFCGRFLLIRLAQLRFPIKTTLLYIFGILALLLPLLQLPQTYYTIFLLEALVLLGISLIIDIVLAVKHLSNRK